MNELLLLPHAAEDKAKKSAWPFAAVNHLSFHHLGRNFFPQEFCMSIILCIDCELVGKSQPITFASSSRGLENLIEACLGCIEMLLVAGETIALQLVLLS